MTKNIFIIVYIISIIFIMLIPSSYIEDISVNNELILFLSKYIEIDKFFHFIIFFLTSFIFYILFKYRYIYILIISFTLGLLIEILQYYLDFLNRSFDIKDLLFDTLGSLLFIIILDLYKHIYKR